MGRLGRSVNEDVWSVGVGVDIPEHGGDEARRGLDIRAGRADVEMRAWSR